MPHLVLFHLPAKSSSSPTYIYVINIYNQFQMSLMNITRKRISTTCYFPFLFLNSTSSASLSSPLAFLQFFFWWLKKQNLGDDGSNTSLVCIRSKLCLLEGINIYAYLNSFPFLI